MKALIIGIDGYIGWPLAVRLVGQGFTVLGVDDLSRRRFVRQLQCCSVTPAVSLPIRVSLFRSGIQVWIGNAFAPDFLTNLLRAHSPDLIFYLSKDLMKGVMGCSVRSLDAAGLNRVRAAMDEVGRKAHLVYCPDELPHPQFGETAVRLGAVFGLNNQDISTNPNLCTRLDVDPCSGLALHRMLAGAMTGSPTAVYGDCRPHLPLEEAVRVLARVAEKVQAGGKAEAVVEAEGCPLEGGMRVWAERGARMWGFDFSKVSILSVPFTEEPKDSSRGIPVRVIPRRGGMDLEAELRRLLGWMTKCEGRLKAMSIPNGMST